jgi:inorganic pyrophosphatase
LTVAHAYFSGKKMMLCPCYGYCLIVRFRGEADISQRLPTIAIYEYVFQHGNTRVGPVRMDIGAISVGPDPPKDIYAVIEIPLGGAPVKYESGALMVDRFLHTAMFYPGNYGFIPRTLSADGDPCDVLVVAQVQVVPGAIVRCRPVGALLMEDEAGRDEKIIAVPVDALAPFYADIRNYRDLPPIMCEQIAHFFQHYKDLEKGKWVTIVKWLDVTGAEKLILEAIARAEKAQAKGHVRRRATRARAPTTGARPKAPSKR